MLVRFQWRDNCDQSEQVFELCFLFLFKTVVTFIKYMYNTSSSIQFTRLMAFDSLILGKVGRDLCFFHMQPYLTC